MSAPVLARRLTLEAATRSPDGAGGATLAWEALGVLWAAVAPLPSPGTFRVTVRGAAPDSPRRPRPGQRLREGSRAPLAIREVHEADPAGRFLDCIATEEGRP